MHFGTNSNFWLCEKFRKIKVILDAKNRLASEAIKLPFTYHKKLEFTILKRDRAIEMTCRYLFDLIIQTTDIDLKVINFTMSYYSCKYTPRHF